MIQRFRFGTTIDTGAVIEELPVTDGNLPFFDLTYSGETDDAISGLEFIYTLKDKDIVYGLGYLPLGRDPVGHGTPYGRFRILHLRPSRW